jgi:hypothetical protein
MEHQERKKERSGLKNNVTIRCDEKLIKNYFHGSSGSLDPAVRWVKWVGDDRMMVRLMLVRNNLLKWISDC